MLRNAVCFWLCGPQAVTLHTSLGDLKLELACGQVPKACEVRLGRVLSCRPCHPLTACPCVFVQNFLAHCAAGSYTDTVFHRNIKGFIVQGGDPTGAAYFLSYCFFVCRFCSPPVPQVPLCSHPLWRMPGTGKGGDSVWGGKIPDEFHPELRVRPMPQCAAQQLAASP